jgi:small-conductance mechanosensitive channel
VHAVVGLLACGLAAAAVAEPPADTPNLYGAIVTSPSAAPVVVWNRRVAELRASVGATTPEERASRAERRIGELPDAELAIRPNPTELGGHRAVVITGGTQLLFAIFAEDLAADGSVQLDEYGTRVAAALGDALRARRSERRLPTLLRELALSVAATVAFGAAILLLVRARRSLLARFEAEHALPWHHVVLGVDIAPVAGVLGQAATRVAALVTGVGLTYAWLTWILGRFSYTQPWASGLGGYLTGLCSDLASGAVRAIPGVFAVVVIVAMTRAIARAASAIFARAESGRLGVAWLDADTARATRRIVVGIIWLFGVVVAYPYIPGSETGVFKGISVFFGLLVTLGSSNLVNQVMSGLVLVYARAMRPGDYVKAGEVEGTVTHVGVISTKIANHRMEEVTIPNAVLVGATVTNYSRLAGVQGAVASTKVTIGYDAPWRQVHALLLRAASGTAGIRRDTAPRVLQRALSDFYVEYQLLVSVERPELRLEVLSDLHAAIQDAFNEAGVQIMSPHFVLQPTAKVCVAPKDREGPPLEGDTESSDRAVMSAER